MFKPETSVLDDLTQRASTPLADAAAQIELLQERLAELEHEREHQERLATLGTIAGLIAHEFNNILTPMLGYAQMALAKPDDARLCREALTRAHEGAERAGKIASAILGFVRDDHALPSGGSGGAAMSDGSTWNTLAQVDVSNGERSLAEVPAWALEGDRADLRQSVERALACLARDPARDGVKLTVEIEPGLSALIAPVAAEHIILNLILNARNAMLPRGGELRITADACRSLPELETDEVGNASGLAGDGWIVIDIIDTGRGIRSDQVAMLVHGRRRARQRGPLPTNATPSRSDRASVRPQRESATRTTDYRGTGLGMVICRRLIERAGGELRIRSAVGEGTRVRIVLRRG